VYRDGSKTDAQITSRAFVTSAAGGFVAVIDDATQTFVPVAVSGGPWGVAFSPDGRRAYVTSQNAAIVTIIDVATNTTVGAPIAIAGDAAGIAVTPDGRFAYVSVRGPNQVDVIDLATNTLLTTIPLVFTHLGSSRRQTVSTSTSPSSPVPASCWSTSPPTR
jgi:YVTN family beta-propeller protein